MMLTDIEHKLSVIHNKELISPYLPGQGFMSRPAIYNIISGGNYRMDNLLSLVKSYGLLLFLNGEAVSDLDSLAKILVNIRKSANVSQRRLFMMIKEIHPSFSNSRIYAIESGKNYQKSSFLDYCSGFEKIQGTVYKWDLAKGVSPLSDDEFDSL